jgi:surface polysaccharide O-acyltransferase-like enzyme
VKEGDGLMSTQEVVPSDNPFVVISKTLPTETTAAFLIIKNNINNKRIIVPIAIVIAVIFVPLYCYKALEIRNKIQILISSIIFIIWYAYNAIIQFTLEIQQAFGIPIISLEDYLFTAAVIIGLIIPLILYKRTDTTQ